MKKSLSLIMLSLFASSAFATHAYRSETCLSQSTTQQYKLVYNGNYPMGGSSSLSKVGSDEEVIVWESEEQPDSSINEFTVVSGKLLKRKVTQDKCTKDLDVTFRNEFSKLQTVVNISKLSPEDEAKLGLKSGTHIIFNCDSEFNMPVKCK